MLSELISAVNNTQKMKHALQMTVGITLYLLSTICTTLVSDVSVL